MNNYEFEILATDTTGEVVIENEKNFNYSLLANNKLWGNADIVKGIIRDSSQNLTVAVKLMKVEEDIRDSLQKTFVIKVKGPFESVEKFRIKVLEYLQVLKFDTLYVLKDEVSMEIAQKLYPGINRVESTLRKYIIKFLVTKLGPKWWDLTADSEMQKKTNLRKRNETVFSDFIDNRVYLIDFGELGRIIHSQSSGYLKKEDIIEKVTKLEETSEAIQKLKEEIQSNYNKFFKSAFKQNDFQKKWEDLEKIRHKIAHNNLFTSQDLERGNELIKELEAIITIADKSIESLSFSSDEKEALMDSFLSLDDIDKATFLNELSKSQEWAYRNADNFVGLKNFVETHLGGKGYRFKSTWDMVKQLEEEGLVELYTFTSEKNEFGVSAIRISNPHQIKTTLGDYF